MACTAGCRRDVRQVQHFPRGPDGLRQDRGRQIAWRGCSTIRSSTAITRSSSARGADIPLIFEREGEAGFRRREREVIAELARREGIVLATGGGAVLDADNRRDLQGAGWVVYLESVGRAAERARRAHAPPASAAGRRSGPAAGRADARREPLYREIADLAVSTDHRRVQCGGRAHLAAIPQRRGPPQGHRPRAGRQTGLARVARILLQPCKRHRESGRALLSDPDRVRDCCSSARWRRTFRRATCCWSATPWSRRCMRQRSSRHCPGAA